MNEELRLKNIYDKYCENKNSHVYLVQTDSIDDAIQDIKRLIINVNKHNGIDVENLIENDTLPTLMLIKPDKNEIKTEEAEKLLTFLQKIPVITNENFFIVEYAEKLNAKSGNQLLKVIEEPDSDILGFFVCLNAENVLPTIKSRLQFVQLNYNKKTEYNSKTIEFVDKYFDMIHKQIDLSLNKVIVDNFKEYNDMKLFLDCFVDKEKKYINELSDFDIIKKEGNILKLVFVLEEKIHNNANINLMLDKFLLEVGRL